MKHAKYLSYVIRHKWFVLLAGLRVKAPIGRLLIHDWSKFLPCEWLPYARFFYGDYPEWNRAKIECPGYSYAMTKEGIAQSFDRAWLHHLHWNQHHWQHWVLRNDSGTEDVLPMPDRLVREMVADWMGAGRAITGKWEAREWYLKNRANQQLHPDTRRRVEQLLGVARA